MSPTSRSLALLRHEGYLPAVVERWIPKLERRSDLWHFGDLLAVHAQRREFLIVQTTSLANVSARVRKAQGRPELEQWLLAGGRFEVHGWGQHAGEWRCKRVEIQPGSLQPVVTVPMPRRTRGAAAWQPGALFGEQQTT